MTAKLKTNNWPEPPPPAEYTEPDQAYNVELPRFNPRKDQLNSAKTTMAPDWSTGGFNLGKHIINYCEKTSLVGLQYCADAPYKLERILWAVFFFVGLFIALFMVKDAVTGWVENPVQIVMETTNYPTSKIPFPAVSVVPYSQTGYRSSYVNR